MRENLSNYLSLLSPSFVLAPDLDPAEKMAGTRRINA